MTTAAVSDIGSSVARAHPFDAYLSDARAQVLSEILRLVDRPRYGPMLYDLMRDYPLRSAKGLRPALCIAVCRALGGRLADVLRTATVLELYHNAFLIHDDVEDGSHFRRGSPTLHEQHGVAIAVNVGDAMLALALRPLLDNTRTLGLGKALRILDVVSRMAVETAEGQALELHWIRHGLLPLRDVDYWHLVFKKTCWYTFLAPMMVGAEIAGAPEGTTRRLRKLATLVGVAFQIQDDVLNLTSEFGSYGKEIDGDLDEGKRTLILMHMLRHASTSDRARARVILALPVGRKSQLDIAWLRQRIEDHDSLDYARSFAAKTARRAQGMLADLGDVIPPSVHRDFIHDLVEHVVQRTR